MRTPATCGIDEALIQRLVRGFYTQMRQDDLLGPIFRFADPVRPLKAELGCCVALYVHCNPRRVVENASAQGYALPASAKGFDDRSSGQDPGNYRELMLERWQVSNERAVRLRGRPNRLTSEVATPSDHIERGNNIGEINITLRCPVLATNLVSIDMTDIQRRYLSLVRYQRAA